MTNAKLLPTTLLFVAALLFAACGDKATPDTGNGAEDAHAHEGHDHEQGPHEGQIAVLGDHAAHLEVVVDHDLEMMEVYAYDADLKPVKFDAAPIFKFMHDGKSHRLVAQAHEDGTWMFEGEVLGNHIEKGRFDVVIGGTRYAPDLPAHGHDHDGHEGHEDGDHDHAEHGMHDGVVAALEGGHGYVELKLHDDLGDLELWLTTDEDGKTPLDLPLDATIKVSFAGKGKIVELKVRDTEKNADEDGKANLRDGKTNYFIFPGRSGADASWLKGADFDDEVVVAIKAGSASYTTAKFELRPHTHAGGDDHEGHDHE